MIYLILAIAVGMIALVALFQVFIPGPTDYQRDAWPSRRQGGSCWSKEDVRLTEIDEPPTKPE